MTDHPHGTTRAESIPESSMPTLGWRAAFASIAQRYPETKRSGPWEIRRFSVTTEEERFARLRAAINPQHGARYVPAGEYVGLWHDKRGPVMSATPDEICDHHEPYFQASRRGPDTTVLLGGLGLGMVLHAILQLPNVAHVQVIEIDRDVIGLGSDAFLPEIQSGRLAITWGDALTFTWPKGRRWSVAWWDIWDSICEDNRTDMHTLKRRYARRVDWHGCWSEPLLRRRR